jgi:hypothetical protein
VTEAANAAWVGAVDDQTAWTTCTDGRWLIWYAELFTTIPAATLTTACTACTLLPNSTMTPYVTALRSDTRSRTVFVHELCNTGIDAAHVLALRQSTANAIRSQITYAAVVAAGG